MKMISRERWLPVEGYPRYHVSNHGRVRGPRKMLTPQVSKCGYPQVGLWLDGKRDKVATIHRLVAEAFIGPRPDGLEVNHKDEDKSNNHDRNLEYVTHGYNVEFSHAKHYRFIDPNGEIHEVFNLCKFCRNMGLHQGNMTSVWTGNRGSHKQWRKS